MRRRWLAVCLAYVLSGCASGATVRSREPPLTLTLARADGRTIALSAYTGQPLLLFLFATYDQTSQLALVELTQFLRQHASVQVAGVLLQPDAATFLPLFKEAVSLPFELYYDPTSQILQGETALGRLRGIPAFVALGERGQIKAIRYGVQRIEQLEALTEP